MKRFGIALYAFAAVTVVAFASSVLLLSKVGIGLALVAALPPSLLLGFIGLASRYLCRAMPLQSANRYTIAAAVTGSAIAASGLWVLTWKSWIAALVTRRIWTTDLDAPYQMIFALGLLLYLTTVAVQYLVLEVEVSREAEEAALRYRVLAREAELRAFKAQVDPHFLFNSLNAVASLCGSRPDDARLMAQRLADFFRLILRLGAQERITLAEEMDLVTRYLDIEKVRFGERLKTNISVDDGSAQCLVPPLLLQPLVENAVRHGVASVVEGGTIDITASLRDGMLRIVIDNPADPERIDQSGEGIGMKNARGRLQTVSDGKAVFQAAENEGRFHVSIELPR